MIPSSVIKRASSILIWIGPLTTLAISPAWSYDPINPIKVLLMVSLSFAALGLYFPYLNSWISMWGKDVLIPATLFVLALLSSFLFSGASRIQQFWGVFGRNTGILTYLGLLMLFLLAVSVNDLRTTKKIVNGLMATAFVLVIYCSFQVAGKDPVKWSAFAPFGTLGNINFLSGFMGIAMTSFVVLSLEKKLSRWLRLGYLCICAAGLYIVTVTDSIQGLVSFSLGFACLIFFKILRLGRTFVWTYICFLILGLVNLVLALMDKGPLKGLIYQITIVYRGDYMHAGIEMLLSHPIFGVGIDSYDDWYRSQRGFISAFRNSLQRTSNSAHNIALDLGSGGGLPLLLAYLLILGVVALYIVKGFKKGYWQNSIFVTLTCCWIAYQVQAAVSINQIGVGVWGWILSGLLISTVRTLGAKLESGEVSSSRVRSTSSIKSSKNRQIIPPAISIISSSIAIAIGFSLSFLPFKTDMDFRSANDKRNLVELTESALRLSTNSFLVNQAQEIAIKSNSTDFAKRISDFAIVRFPRNIYAWQARSILTNISDQEKGVARSRFLTLDPNFALCLESDPIATISAKLNELPPPKQFELATWWGLASNSDISRTFTFSALPSEKISEKIRSICG